MDNPEKLATHNCFLNVANKIPVSNVVDE